MSEYYVLEGHEAKSVDSLIEWAKRFEGDNRHVARTQVADGVSVSTVFLGIDHRFGDGPPLLFETLVFGGPWDGEMERYSTWGEAETGHAEMVARVSDTLPKGRDAQQGSAGTEGSAVPKADAQTPKEPQ